MPAPKSKLRTYLDEIDLGRLDVFTGLVDVVVDTVEDGALCHHQVAKLLVYLM